MLKKVVDSAVQKDAAGFAQKCETGGICYSIRKSAAATLPLPSPALLNGQHVHPVGVGVGDAIHGLFDHEDAKAADLPLLGPQGGVRVGLLGGIVGPAVVGEAEDRPARLHLASTVALVAPLYRAMLEKISSMATLTWAITFGGA